MIGPYPDGIGGWARLAPIRVRLDFSQSSVRGRFASAQTGKHRKPNLSNEGGSPSGRAGRQAGEIARLAGLGRSILSSPGYGGRRSKMLETIAVILIVLWLLGFLTSYTMGGFIHALLVIAVVVIAIRLIQGRRV